MSSDLSLTGKQRSEENNTKMNCILYPFYIWSQFFQPEENVLLRRFDYQPSYNLFGSLYVSGKLPTYPSPKPTLTLTSHLGQNVDLGEG